MVIALPSRYRIDSPEMTDLSLTILQETADDALAIERLHERTFGPGRFARTAYRIREGAGHALALSFVARIGTLLVGSVRLTPIRVGKTPALLLGPRPIPPVLPAPALVLAARPILAGPAGMALTVSGRRELSSGAILVPPGISGRSAAVAGGLVRCRPFLRGIQCSAAVSMASSGITRAAGTS